MRNTVRLNFEFPRSEYPFLKMMCASRGTSLKALATELILKELEDYEDRVLTEKAVERVHEMNENDNVPFDEACKLASWKNDENV